MLDVYRRSERCREAQIHERDHRRSLRGLYARALLVLETVDSHSEPVKIDWFLQFDMSDIVSVPVTDKESVNVRIGIEKRGWISHAIGWDSEPNVLFEFWSHVSDSTPSYSHQEQYILVSDGNLHFCSDGKYLRVPDSQIQNRITLIEEATKSFQKLSPAQRKE